MEKFQLLAQPWWVNLLLFVPPITALVWRRKGGLQFRWRQFVFLAVFAAAFGFVEASVVVYLRAAVGLLPGYQGTLAEVQRSAETYQQEKSISDFPQSLVTIEVFREGATLAMLACVGLLAAPRARERWAAFLWTFALWDLTYYAGLWATVRWPVSLKDLDVLFLLPVPWMAQVWFPILVSFISILAVALSRTEVAP
jgi:hypothetical protein